MGRFALELRAVCWAGERSVGECDSTYARLHMCYRSNAMQINTPSCAKMHGCPYVSMYALVRMCDFMQTSRRECGHELTHVYRQFCTYKLTCV